MTSSFVRSNILVRAAACASLVAMLPSAHAASSLFAYSSSVGGQSILAANGQPFGCATFGPDPLLNAFQGTGQTALPTDGSVCGVGSDVKSIKAPSGNLLVSSNLGVSFGSSTDLKTFNGSATGRASYGNIGVQAAGSYSGTTNSFVVDGSEAAALQTESMNIRSGLATTTSGFYDPTITIDGSMFTVGRNRSELSFFYAVDGGPMYLSFRILYDDSGVLSFYEPGGYVSTPAGIKVTGSAGTGYTIAGSTSITLDIPIIFGAASDVTFAMFASDLPGPDTGLLSGSSGNVSFANSAKLTGIQILDANHKALSDFSIASGSGTQYDANGVVTTTAAVPEPQTWALMAFGLGAIGVSATRRRSLGSRR